MPVWPWVLTILGLAAAAGAGYVAYNERKTRETEADKRVTLGNQVKDAETKMRDLTARLETLESESVQVFVAIDTSGSIGGKQLDAFLGEVRGILRDSGWGNIGITPVDVPCVLPERALVGYFTRLGPLGLVLREADEEARARIIGTVRAAFDPYVHGEEVRFTAACWQVDAQAPASA